MNDCFHGVLHRFVSWTASGRDFVQRAPRKFNHLNRGFFAAVRFSVIGRVETDLVPPRMKSQLHSATHSLPDCNFPPSTGNREDLLYQYPIRGCCHHRAGNKDASNLKVRHRATSAIKLHKRGCRVRFAAKCTFHHAIYTECEVKKFANPRSKGKLKTQSESQEPTSRSSAQP